MSSVREGTRISVFHGLFTRKHLTAFHVLGRNVNRNGRSKQNNKIVNYQYINGEMERKASFNKKTRSNAIATHSDTKRNIPGGLSFAITPL